MNRIFYSLPPAGNTIPFSILSMALVEGNRNGGLEQSEALKKVVGDAFVLYQCSGRAALWLILKTLSKLQPERKSVVIPAYTCPAVASAVYKAGLKPILCDINLDDFGYCIEDLDRIVDESVLGVISVHLFGFPANIDAVISVCRRHSTFVIEDAAQAFGNELSTGTKLGLVAEVGFFSFGRGKPLSTIHGGLVVTKSETIYEGARSIYEVMNESSRVDNLKYLFQIGCYDLLSSPYLYWLFQKFPSLHLGETIFEPDFSVTKGLKSCGSILNGLLDSLESGKKDRMAKSQWYGNELPDSPIIRKPHLTVYPYHRYPLFLEDQLVRHSIMKELSSIGISGTLFYPCPLNELPGLREVLQDDRTYVNAKQLSDELVMLPVHEGVSFRDMKNVKSVFETALKT